MNYTFKKETEYKINGGSKLCNIYDIGEFDKQVLALGQLKTLFGEPHYITENLENQFSYLIAATDETGKTIHFDVYSASSGPAIGGMHGKEYEEAAKALKKHIRQADASDYDYEGYYLDAPCKVRMGVKNGVPYTEEEMLDLTEEEFVKLFERVN